MNYEILYDEQPKRLLKKLDKHISERILKTVRRVLTDNAVPQNAKSIMGKHGVFRLRIGPHRILYRLDNEQNSIVVFKIDKRSRVYERL